MTFTWKDRYRMVGSSSAGRTKVGRGGGKDRGGIKQTCEEELMRARVYGMGWHGKSRDLNNGWADKTAPAIYHRQWPSSLSSSSLPSFLPSFLSHPSRFIVIPNLLSGISSASRVVYTKVRRRRKHNRRREKNRASKVGVNVSSVDRFVVWNVFRVELRNKFGRTSLLLPFRKKLEETGSWLSRKFEEQEETVVLGGR